MSVRFPTVARQEWQIFLNITCLPTIIKRNVYSEIPPRVEYKLTNYGKSLMPVIDVIQQWGEKGFKK